MIVEFIGTPGAGKSTLLPAVIASFRERGVQACTVVEAARPYARRTLIGGAVARLSPAHLQQPLLWQVFYSLSFIYRLKFMIRHPRLVGRVWASQVRRPESAGARERRVLYWFFHQAGIYEFLTARADAGEALVFDEGFIHRVVQLYASAVETPDPARIASYIDLLPVPNLVVVPRAPIEVCERRVYSRGVWHHFRHRSAGELSQYLANAALVVNLTVDYIKRKGWQVIEIDNGQDDPAPAIAEVRSRLAQMAGLACHQAVRQPALAIENP
jgi:hypothetical protein